MSREPDVAIVGGGPVGLYLALALLHDGMCPRVYERAESDGHGGSRSIGVHPPSLELFDEIGVTDAFLAHAVRVRRGLAFGERGLVGDVSFEVCPGPHRYVATLEQWKTERVLREALMARAPDALVTGVEVRSVRSERGGATVSFGQGGREEATFSAVIGADGRRSAVRHALGIPFDGDVYEGEYAMADAPECTSFGDAAAVFLTGGGLVESFPLPERRRRWVVRRAPESESASGDRAAPSRAEIVEVVGERTRVALREADLDAPSAFRAEHRLARTLSEGRVALVGDAAHVVSPIGGQGMNLGWLGARSVAKVLARELGARRDPEHALARDALLRRGIAKTATRRAEMNMWLGRPTAHPRFRETLVSGLLGLPTARVLARAFTMRALELGV